MATEANNIQFRTVAEAAKRKIKAIYSCVSQTHLISLFLSLHTHTLLVRNQQMLTSVIFHFVASPEQESEDTERRLGNERKGNKDGARRKFR